MGYVYTYAVIEVCVCVVRISVLAINYIIYGSLIYLIEFEHNIYTPTPIRLHYEVVISDTFDV